MATQTKELGSLPLKTTLADTDQIIIADGASAGARMSVAEFKAKFVPENASNAPSVEAVFNIPAGKTIGEVKDLIKEKLIKNHTFIESVCVSGTDAGTINHWGDNSYALNSTGCITFVKFTGASSYMFLLAFSNSTPDFWSLKTSGSDWIVRKHQGTNI